MCFVIEKNTISASFKMDKFIEQRLYIKFCFKNGISCGDAVNMLKKCYGDETMTASNIYKCYSLFKDGRETFENEPRSGRPSTSRNE